MVLLAVLLVSLVLWWSVAGLEKRNYCLSQVNITRANNVVVTNLSSLIPSKISTFYTSIPSLVSLETSESRIVVVLNTLIAVVLSALRVVVLSTLIAVVVLNSLIVVVLSSFFGPSVLSALSCHALHDHSHGQEGQEIFQERHL
jgi:hypothetical protein